MICKFQKSVEYFLTECIWLNHAEKRLETFGETTMMSWVSFKDDKFIESWLQSKKLLEKIWTMYVSSI